MGRQGFPVVRPGHYLQHLSSHPVRRHARALHIDSLADSIDGIMGGKDLESRLAIMQDAGSGPQVS
jgi:hypothetical protein